MAGRWHPGGHRGGWRATPGEGGSCLRPGALRVGARGWGNVGCYVRGWGVGEGGTNLFFSFVFKKKKQNSNLHHDFLTNLGEGGLPAWSCLIRSLRRL